MGDDGVMEVTAELDIDQVIALPDHSAFRSGQCLLRALLCAVTACLLPCCNVVHGKIFSQVRLVFRQAWRESSKQMHQSVCCGALTNAKVSGHQVDGSGCKQVLAKRREEAVRAGRMIDMSDLPDEAEVCPAAFFFFFFLKLVVSKAHVSCPSPVPGLTHKLWWRSCCQLALHWLSGSAVCPWCLGKASAASEDLQTCLLYGSDQLMLIPGCTSGFQLSFLQPPIPCGHLKLTNALQSPACLHPMRL